MRERIKRKKIHRVRERERERERERIVFRKEKSGSRIDQGGC